MAKIASIGGKYSHQQRAEVAIQYAVSGDLEAVAKATGIPQATIIGWKHLDWWDAVVDGVRHEKAEEHRARYSQSGADAQQLAVEKPPEASSGDAMITAAPVTDKTRTHDRVPTAITGDSTEMAALAEDFRQLSRQWHEKSARAITTQDETDEVDRG
jgi:hypothetical protein